MARRARLDAELVRRKLARSREQAAALVEAGRVQVRGTVARKAAAMIDPAEPVVVTGEDPATAYVSRGGHKLAGALAVFGPVGLTVAGRRCLDAGASTGGFTDCLLQHGAAKVHAIDVGTNQLAYKLRTDPRVVVKEQFNARGLEVSTLGEKVRLIVMDLSFISLTKILPAAFGVLEEGGFIVCLIKPQFELEREDIGKGGIVTDDAAIAGAIEGITAFMQEKGWRPITSLHSPIVGGDGNRETVAVFRRT